MDNPGPRSEEYSIQIITLLDGVLFLALEFSSTHFDVILLKKGYHFYLTPNVCCPQTGKYSVIH